MMEIGWIDVTVSRDRKYKAANDPGMGIMMLVDK
jgi:hypothetical protein